MCFNAHHLQILLPHAFLDNFILFTIDKHECRVYILDPCSEPLSEERYQLKLQRCSFYLNDALEIAQPGWNSDIYFWPRKYPHNIPIPTSPDRRFFSVIFTSSLFIVILITKIMICSIYLQKIVWILSI